MKHLLPLVLILTCCSGRVDSTGNERQHLTAAQTLTVCPLEPGDRELAQAAIEAVNYWWEQGHDVEYTDGPYCLVRLRINRKSHAPSAECYDGNPATDGWCNGVVAVSTYQVLDDDTPRIDGFAPATVTLRLEPWRRMSDGARVHTIAHEVGHTLGLHHSAAMPMRSCEHPEWCFDDSDVESWYAGL